MGSIVNNLFCSAKKNYLKNVILIQFGKGVTSPFFASITLLEQGRGCRREGANKLNIVAPKTGGSVDLRIQ